MENIHIQTSSDKFKEMIENEYVGIRKYVHLINDYKAILEVPGEEGFVWKNENLSPIFKQGIFPINKSSISYNEKFDFYVIELGFI